MFIPLHFQFTIFIDLQNSWTCEEAFLFNCELLQNIAFPQETVTPNIHIPSMVDVIM